MDSEDDIDNIKKGGRRVMYSDQEEVIIMEEVEKRQADLIGAFVGAGGGNKKRQLAWKSVAEKVNSMSQSGVMRTGKQIKKKYENIKAQAKSKLTQKRHPPTGGGPPPKEPKLSEQLFLNMMADTPGLEGIPGGVDTAESQIEIPCVEKESNEVETGPSTATATSNEVSSQIYPAPGIPKIRKPRADKVASDLHLEVLAAEKKRIELDIALARQKKLYMEEEHKLKMEVLNLQKVELLQKMGLLEVEQ